MLTTCTHFNVVATFVLIVFRIFPIFVTTISTTLLCDCTKLWVDCGKLLTFVKMMGEVSSFRRKFFPPWSNTFYFRNARSELEVLF